MPVYARAEWPLLRRAIASVYAQEHPAHALWLLINGASAEERKDLIKGQFGRRHHLASSLLLALMVLGTFGGMAVTYLNNGKLFVGPHLLVGLTMTSLVALASALTPLMQQGNLLARKAHVGLNMGMVTLFLWQALSGTQILLKVLANPVA